MTCQEVGCSAEGRMRRGLCSVHYRRLCAAGLPPRSRPTPSERFWAKVAEVGDCWEWQGDRNHGYGRFTDAGRRLVQAHRFAYEDMVGQIPAGLQLDHLCKNRACVNPFHLEPVTARVNTRRSESFAGRNGRKTHCPQGHLYDDINTRIDNRGCRCCRSCESVNNAKYYQRRKSVA